VTRRRSYGTGSIWKLPSGRYRTRVWVHGENRQATHDSHGEARDWLERQLAGKHTRPRPGAWPGLRLRELRDEWLADCKALGRTEKTLRGYTTAIDAVLETHGDRLVEDVTPGLLRGLLTEWRGLGWSDSTQRNRLAALTGMTRYAMERDYVPARELPVRRPRGDLHSRPEVYSATECDDLLRAATSAGPWHELAVRLGLDAGLRLGEAFLAKPADLRDGVLRIPKTKNHRPRSVPVPVALTRAWEAVTPRGGWMVRSPTWTTETPLDRALRPVWVAAGVDYGFHRLRHTWASRLANGPVPATPWELMTWGGWRTLAMVTRYYHAPETIRRGPVDSLSSPGQFS
jgi:integrase